MEQEPVQFYGGGFGCFSNMSAYAVEIDGTLFMTSEHAYQYAKFSDPNIKEEILQARSGYMAKMIALKNAGREVPNWHEIKLFEMEQILRKKLAQHPHIQDKLLATVDREIVEASPSDAYWGWGPDKIGENQHGKLWMKLREELNRGL